MTMMMMMMNCFCGMVDWRKAFSLISSQGHCQRSSPSWISDMPRAGFEPAQDLSSGFVEWSCVVVITTTPRCHNFAPGWHICLLKKMSSLFILKTAFVTGREENYFKKKTSISEGWCFFSWFVKLNKLGTATVLSLNLDPPLQFQHKKCIHCFLLIYDKPL